MKWMIRHVFSHLPLSRAGAEHFCGQRRGGLLMDGIRLSGSQPHRAASPDAGRVASSDNGAACAGRIGASGRASRAGGGTYATLPTGSHPLTINFCRSLFSYERQTLVGGRNMRTVRIRRPSRRRKTPTGVPMDAATPKIFSAVDAY
jgi:hypothetical protein